MPGGVQKTCRHGPAGHGLAGMGVLGGWLEWVISEVFSNFNDSMTRLLEGCINCAWNVTVATSEYS